ncbi:unnamed protein product [Schistosoma curassoni]|uniref:NAC domain-containing protein n=1 Tax=Schistosoma curassoni TaxID=6186 RepID=A0A183L6Y2_9TREM|nr:unnamed protein product [Schistosoma curassoni]
MNSFHMPSFSSTDEIIVFYMSSMTKSLKPRHEIKFDLPI